MRRQAISDDLAHLAFEFFYSFSRLEFALKENAYLKDLTPDAPAEPGWDKFTSKWANRYAASTAGKELIQRPPKRQVGTYEQWWSGLETD
jgi:hypothetical protein